MVCTLVSSSHARYKAHNTNKHRQKYAYTRAWESSFSESHTYFQARNNDTKMRYSTFYVIWRLLTEYSSLWQWAVSFSVTGSDNVCPIVVDQICTASVVLLFDAYFLFFIFFCTQIHTIKCNCNGIELSPLTKCLLGQCRQIDGRSARYFYPFPAQSAKIHTEVRFFSLLTNLGYWLLAICDSSDNGGMVVKHKKKCKLKTRLYCAVNTQL